mgnify:CR=1 FL=1
MGQVAFGVSAIEIGDINAGTGLGENYSALGDVVKNSFKINEEEPTLTKHFAELKRYPVEVSVQNNGEQMEFGLLEVGADNLVRFLGGTATDVVGVKDKWSAPAGHVDIENAIKVTTEDGTVIEYLRVKILGYKTIDVSREGKFTVMVKGEVLQPKVDGVPAVTVEDNVITNP